MEPKRGQFLVYTRANATRAVDFCGASNLLKTNTDGDQQTLMTSLRKEFVFEEV